MDTASIAWELDAELSGWPLYPMLGPCDHANMRSKLNCLLCFLALALPVLLLALWLSAQTTKVVGVIKGRVVTSDGTSVKGAEVHAELLGRPTAKAIRYVTADEAGEFLID